MPLSPTMTPDQSNGVDSPGIDPLDVETTGDWSALLGLQADQSAHCLLVFKGQCNCNETRRPPDNGGPSCSCRGGGGRLPSATAGPLCPERDPAPAYHRDKPDSSARGAVPNLQTTWKGRCPLRRVPSQRSRRLACRWACRRPSPRTGAPYMYTWHMAHGTWQYTWARGCTHGHVAVLALWPCKPNPHYVTKPPP